MRHLVWAAILSLPACSRGPFIYDDRCGEESRDVTTEQRIRTVGGDSMGYATVILGESRAGYREASWFIFSARLQGHLQEARLVASEDSSSLILPLTGVPYEPEIILQGEMRPYAGPVDFDQVFSRALAGGLTLVLETDLPGFRVIALPLQVLASHDWSRGHCS
jgi:hypothetical protein